MDKQQDQLQDFQENNHVKNHSHKLSSQLFHRSTFEEQSNQNVQQKDNNNPTYDEVNFPQLKNVLRAQQSLLMKEENLSSDLFSPHLELGHINNYNYFDQRFAIDQDFNLQSKGEFSCQHNEFKMTSNKHHSKHISDIRPRSNSISNPNLFLSDLQFDLTTRKSPNKRKEKRCFMFASPKEEVKQQDSQPVDFQFEKHRDQTFGSDSNFIRIVEDTPQNALDIEDYHSDSKSEKSFSVSKSGIMFANQEVSYYQECINQMRTSSLSLPQFLNFESSTKLNSSIYATDQIQPQHEQQTIGIHEKQQEFSTNCNRSPLNQLENQISRGPLIRYLSSSMNSDSDASPPPKYLNQNRKIGTQYNQAIGIPKFQQQESVKSSRKCTQINIKQSQTNVFGLQSVSTRETENKFLLSTHTCPDQYIPILINGNYFIKHNRWSKPKLRKIWYDSQKQRICWGDPKKSTSNIKGYFTLKCIRDIKEGQSKSTKAKCPNQTSKIFSISARFKSLELEAPTRESFQTWKGLFERLIQDYKDKKL
eukprot:403333711